MAYLCAGFVIVATIATLVRFVTAYTEPSSTWRVRARMAWARVLSVGAAGVVLMSTSAFAFSAIVMQACSDVDAEPPVDDAGVDGGYFTGPNFDDAGHEYWNPCIENTPDTKSCKALPNNCDAGIEGCVCVSCCGGPLGSPSSPVTTGCYID